MYTFDNKTFAPSIISKNGVLVAAMCKAAAERNWGYIEVVTRRSTDGGKTWSEETVAAAPPARAISSDVSNTKSSFFLNPVMALAPSGEIVMLVTFFPESKGTSDVKYLEKKKTAFTYFDGERCPVIYDRDGSYYVVMNNGAVIDKTKAKTAFTVKGIGELYKSGEYIGNIYLNGARGKSETDAKTTFGSMLKTPKRSYIFMLKSDDMGISWSEPKDITPNIITGNDGPVVMTAPGRGLTTESGRMIFPLYNAKEAISVYTDNSGDSWSRNPKMPYTGGKGCWSAVQTPDGLIQAFSEGATAVSEDNGILWAGGDKINGAPSKSKRSAIIVKECIFVTSRLNKVSGGILCVADFIYDKNGKYKSFKWRKKPTQITDERFDAPCIASIDDIGLGVIFECGNEVKYITINIE